MSNYDRPHTYDKAPSPSAWKHRAAQSAQQSWEDHEGIGPVPKGRRAAK